MDFRSAPGSISTPATSPSPSSAPSTASPSTAPAWPVSVNLRRRGAVGVDGGADDAHFVAGGDDFKAAALQRAHFHHLVQEPVQQSDVDESYVRPGNKKHSRTFHVDAGSGGSSQSAVTQHYKFRAARVTCAGVFENFFRLKVQESQAHGTETKDSFEVPAATATAEVFLRVQCDDRVPAFPNSFAGRIAAETDAITERPHTHELVQFSLCRGDSRSHHVGVIKNTNVRAREFAAQRSG